MHELGGVPVFEALFLGVGGEAVAWDGGCDDVEAGCEKGLEDWRDFGEVSGPPVEEEQWDCFVFSTAFVDVVHVE